ncbi:undecaprenyl-diphosphatase (plasmid) [Bacillus sp. 31A1R]|uniref:Undecaprenyl-diphosphatase n=1 Tax=Robertmurraya mangrovi TaxID=3098077 RepID=A0ABU5IVD3_9BACI|nr:undecaprenyl-diphosphatase [Bacillus sp. 31A1R]MDZ5471114.1 undecaprenyl-diphosphatase [Bacillus sp. 31A1R]
MGVSELNIHLFRKINDLGKEYTYLNPSFVIITEYMVIFLALSVVYFWFTRTENNRMMIISASFAFILAEIIGKTAGKFHSNLQPFAELSSVNQLIDKAINNSFPSDHTILFFSFCVSFMLFKKKASFLWILLAMLVGLSRIWVGVHYPFDVLVGALVGSISAVLSYILIQRVKLFNKLLEIYEKVEKNLLPVKEKSKDL